MNEGTGKVGTARVFPPSDTYDLSGNVASVVSSNANGTNVSYAWDANNRLHTVTDNRNGGTTTYAYDATNQVSSFAYPNGVTHAFSYDTRDRPASLALNGPGGVLANYTQVFSYSGHKQSVAENTGRTENYSYGDEGDSQNRHGEKWNERSIRLRPLERNRGPQALIR